MKGRQTRHSKEELDEKKRAKKVKDPKSKQVGKKRKLCLATSNQSELDAMSKLLKLVSGRIDYEQQ